MPPHPWDGYRVYNGCPDSTMQARLDKEAAMLRELQQRYPDAHATYFPMEGLWQVHRWGAPLGGMHPSRAGALASALAAPGTSRPGQGPNPRVWPWLDACPGGSGSS